MRASRATFVTGVVLAIMVAMFTGGGCTSTLALTTDGVLAPDDAGGDEAFPDRSEPTVERGAEDAGLVDAALDAPPREDAGDAGTVSLDGLPVLVIPKRGREAFLPLELSPGRSIPLLVGPDAGGDAWPCGSTSVRSVSNAEGASFDVVLVNEQDVEVPIVVVLFGPTSGAFSPGDVGMAIYLDGALPTDRRACSGVIAVDCTGAKCGTDGTSTMLAILPVVSIPAKARVPVSIFALAQHAYGQIGLVVAARP